MKQNGYIGNTNALKYKDVNELEKAINQYFDNCDKDGRPYTMSGLAYHLGIDRATLVRYGDRDLFANLIKKAKSRVESYLEEHLYRLGNNSGIIFNLKNNYGWRDTVEVKTDEETSKLDELIEALKDVKKD